MGDLDLYSFFYRVLWDHQELPEQLDPRDKLDSLGLKVARGRRVPLDLPDPRGSPERR